MKLSTYIDLYYEGNKTAFARALDVHAPQVHQWIAAGAEVIGETLVIKPRKLPAPKAYSLTAEFEALMQEHHPDKPLDRDSEGNYTSGGVRSAFVGFTLAKANSEILTPVNDEVMFALQTLQNHYGALKASHPDAVTEQPYL